MVTSFVKIMYFWPCWVFAAMHGFFIVAASGGFSLAVMQGLLIEVASLVAEHRPVMPT